MSRTTIQIDREVSVNLGVLEKYLERKDRKDRTKKSLVKELVAERMQSEGLKYKEVAA